ncbi:MAG: isoprenylcysteine carboxylmethyltransferase family protein [Candidatus Omnitrophica bacterium]|nr:isoprenylcysteine carboxylmethyltransferase family protein [Candidatus Omnitrophota bacterium]
MSEFSFYPFRKLRMYFAWIFVLVLVIFAKSTDRGFWIGLPVIALGESIRIWSHGYIQKIRQLATEGPYAYVRNPLYVGNFLIGLGFCIILWNPFLVAAFVTGFYLVYWVTVKGEEQRLESKFQKLYKEYLTYVPRFIPRFSPYEKRGNAAFVFHRLWKHGEHITILAILNLLVLIYLRQLFYQYREPLTQSNLTLLGLWVLLSVFLIFAFVFRYFVNREVTEKA